MIEYAAWGDRVNTLYNITPMAPVNNMDRL